MKSSIVFFGCEKRGMLTIQVSTLDQNCSNTHSSTAGMLVEVYHFDVEPLEDRLVIFSSEWLEHEAGIFDSKFEMQASWTFMAL